MLKNKHKFIYACFCFIFIYTQVNATNQGIVSPQMSLGHFLIPKSFDHRQVLDRKDNLNDSFFDDEIDDNVIDIDDDITLEDIINYENDHEVKKG